MARRKPPRFVPTLTEVVRPATEPRPAPASDLSQEQIVEKVMQRVDLILERRLREAIAAAVLEQTRSIAPMLREEIEAVVRESVARACADEPGARGPT
jgi:hypothetical protein